MKYSVIIPIYTPNESDFRRCLDSIKNQTLQPYEVIVVDDASPTNVPQIAKEYGYTYMRHEVNKHNGGARNTGIRAATGDYLIFCNSDDYFEKNTIEEIDKVNKGQDVIIVGFKTFGNWDRGTIFIPDGDPYISKYNWNGEALHIVNRKFIIENELYELENVPIADRDWTLRLEKVMRTHTFVPLALYNYQVGHEGAIMTKIIKKEIVNNLTNPEYYEKKRKEIGDFMDCGLLILSCDINEDLWQPFFQLKDKYWKKCHFNTYIATETKDCKYAKTIKKNYPIEQWTTRIRETLKEIDTKYILIMIDDFFIRNYVNQDRINYALSKFDDNTAFFNFEQEYDNNNVECGLDGFKKRVNGICKISCQAGIWDREKLIKLLNVSCSPWEWERLNIARDYDYYINSGDLIIDYGFKVGDFSIVRGKWSQEIIPLFEKENIKIDYSKRGFFLSKNKFSIVIPNYNNEKWLKQCIDSVKNQTYRNWELFIADDMSTDNSLEVIEKTIKDYDNIKLFKNEIKFYNGGSRNVGILEAKKSNINGYLLFIDSDDWLADNKVLEDLYNFINRNNCPDVITMGYQYFMNNQTQGSFLSTYDNKFDLFKADGKTMCAVWCKCFKVSVAPLFEYNTLMEDRNYHYRLINRCDTYANFNRITHTWNKMNTKSITTDKDQVYKSDLQSPIVWNNCAYRHIAGMLDLLGELKDQKYIDYIKMKINQCLDNIRRGIYQQL